MDFNAHQPDWFFAGKNRQVAEDNLRDYFNAYTGARFDLLADREHPDVITANDLVAVSTLDVDIPAAKALWILGEGAHAITELLAQIPEDQAIWDRDADLTPEGPAWKLWDLLKDPQNTWPAGRKGTGKTRLSKLLAAKRPNLVPIYDSQIAKALFGHRVEDDWGPWARFHRSAEGSSLRNTAMELAANAGVPSHVGPLRVIDIVIWRWAHDYFRV
jgi:hypothetical protein